MRAAALPVPGSSCTANLNDMAVGWSHDEWRSGRRLVQFWRRQEGTTIHATFRPILPSQYVPNSIVISCIFREDKNECFVTSVDTIYLLEALVASRFTVEEKNRIRRNLEGFRPITVSKNKRECERFFKLIMSFPNPKPRNIEKDVKVFPWKVLASALCKIIGKYSASYEGGPPVLSDLGPDASFGGAMGGSLSSVDLSGGHYRDVSYPSSSPSIKDTRLPGAFDYDRQGGAAGAYAVSNPGAHHSAGYGGNAWNMGSQDMAFNAPGAATGYAQGPGVPSPRVAADPTATLTAPAATTALAEAIWCRIPPRRMPATCTRNSRRRHTRLPLLRPIARHRARARSRLPRATTMRTAGDGLRSFLSTRALSFHSSVRAQGSCNCTSPSHTLHPSLLCPPLWMQNPGLL